MIIDFIGGNGGGSSVTVVDNLQSTSTTAALSAKQGKVLNENKVEVSAMTAYTPTSGFTTINNSAITNGGNIEISASSDILEEIDTLPENPVDGAVYNYNGTLIKYVNAAGNWGTWDGLGTLTKYSQNTLGNATLFYSVIPETMDGQEVFGLGYIKTSSADTNVAIWAFFNLQNDTIDVYKNKEKTGTTLYQIARNAGFETIINNSNVNMYVSWVNNVIQLRAGDSYSQILQWCETSSSTAHYELMQDLPYTYPISRTNVNPVEIGSSSISGYLTRFDMKSGRAFPELMITRRQIYFNNNNYGASLNFFSNDNAPASVMYVPTASGETGTICVSQGATSAPQFKTITQTLGVDFAVLTQAEYDALDPINGGTGYTATRLYFIKDE